MGSLGRVGAFPDSFFPAAGLRARARSGAPHSYLALSGRSQCDVCRRRDGSPAGCPHGASPKTEDQQQCTRQRFGPSCLLARSTGCTVSGARAATVCAGSSSLRVRWSGPLAFHQCLQVAAKERDRQRGPLHSACSRRGNRLLVLIASASPPLSSSASHACFLLSSSKERGEWTKFLSLDSDRLHANVDWRFLEDGAVELIITAPDRPGLLVDLTSAISAQGLNINQARLLRSAPPAFAARARLFFSGLCGTSSSRPESSSAPGCFVVVALLPVFLSEVS